MYNLSFSFESLDELKDFLKKIDKKPKSINDNRGKKTVEFHKQAKQHQVENPDLSYKKCLEIVRKKSKQS